jgi:hypothetical protein
MEASFFPIVFSQILATPFCEGWMKAMVFPSGASVAPNLSLFPKEKNFSLGIRGGSLPATGFPKAFCAAVKGFAFLAGLSEALIEKAEMNSKTKTDSAFDMFIIISSNKFSNS